MEFPEISHVDHSVFHDLMHGPFTRECRRLHPGGWRAGVHHLVMAWQYRWSGELRALTLCRIGRHQVTEFASRTRSWAGCEHCPWRPAP